MSYYTKITTAGLAAITAAMNNNSKVPITYMAFGDGNGFIPEPNENSTALVNEVYRVGVNKVEVHSKNPNWLVCEAIIPSAVGGFNIREVALYDSTGNTMLAVASYPPTYKPTVEEGAAKIQTIRIVIQVDNSGNFELIVDPDVVLATIQYVKEENSKLPSKVNSIQDLINLENPKNGDLVFVTGFHGANFGLLKPYYASNYFCFDSSLANENDGVVIFNGWVRQFNGRLKPEYAGAIGNGKDYDDEAFRRINAWGFNKILEHESLNPNSIPDSQYIIELEPFSQYRIKGGGSTILGSTEPLNTTKRLQRVKFKLIGNGASILFEPQSEFDRLFNIDAFIDQPKVEDVDFYVQRTDSTLTDYNGVIFHLNSGYLNGNGVSISGAGGLSLSNCKFLPRSFVKDGVSLRNRIRRIFEVIGTTQADQIHASGCGFSYFKECFYSENSECVGNTFDGSCSFFGGTEGNSTYFNIKKMHDGFNIISCNFSLNAGDTLVKAIADENSNNYIQGIPAHTINFIKNRYEIYGTGDLTMCNSNFLHVHFDGGDLRIASGSLTTRSIFKAFEKGSISFNRFTFNNAKILSPVISSKATDGNLNFAGITLDYCRLLRSGIEFGTYDGTTEYSIKNSIVNKRAAKQLIFNRCEFINGRYPFSFEIVFDNSIFSNEIKQAHKIILSKQGSAIGNEFEIPPYQLITKVSVTLDTLVPASFSGLRLYFGEKSENKFVDVKNELSDAKLKKDLVIFNGKGVIWKDGFDNKISVYALENGVEKTNIIRSFLTVEYQSISSSENITSEANLTLIDNNIIPVNIGNSNQRPTKHLYVGYEFFDKNLLKPIYCTSVSPVQWCDAMGSIVPPLEEPQA